MVNAIARIELIKKEVSNAFADEIRGIVVYPLRIALTN